MLTPIHSFGEQSLSFTYHWVRRRQYLETAEFTNTPTTDEEKSTLGVKEKAALDGISTKFKYASFHISESVKAHAKDTMDKSPSFSISDKNGKYPCVKILEKTQEVLEQVFAGETVYVLHVDIRFGKIVRHVRAILEDARP